MSGTKVTIKHGSGKPVAGSLKKAELAIDLDNMELWTAQTDGGDPQKIVGGGDDGSGDRDQIEQNKQDIAINTGDIAGNAAQIEINKNNISTNAGNISTNAGDIADTNKRIDELGLNDLTDVDAAAPNRNDYLVFNGADWESEPIALIDTELTYQGAIDMTGPAPVSPKNGDLYINDTDGVVHSSWGAIAGTTVKAGNVVGWADKTARWYLMGDIASGSVTNVQGGTAIIVNDSVPASPVVNLDKTEVDKWYEPKFSKLSAFNKNFGTTAGTVAEGNHVHSQYALTSHTHTEYAPASHTHAYAPTNHTHTEYVGIGAGGTVAAPKIVIGKTGTDPNTLYFVV